MLRRTASQEPQAYSPKLPMNILSKGQGSRRPLRSSSQELPGRSNYDARSERGGGITNPAMRSSPRMDGYLKLRSLSSKIASNPQYRRSGSQELVARTQLSNNPNIPHSSSSLEVHVSISHPNLSAFPNTRFTRSQPSSISNNQSPQQRSVYRTRGQQEGLRFAPDHSDLRKSPRFGSNLLGQR